MRRSVPSPSDSNPAIKALRDAIARGDWALARSAAERLAAEPPPDSPHARSDRARALADLVQSARASRAHLASALTRIKAARRFRNPPPDRQNLVEPISF